MENLVSLFQEISKMQMNKEEEVPCLVVSGCHCNSLTPTGSCQKSSSFTWVLHRLILHRCLLQIITPVTSHRNSAALRQLGGALQAGHDCKLLPVGPFL